MLSVTQLQGLNEQLLTNNVYKDNHYNIMYSFSTQSHLSNKQIKTMVSILRFYANNFKDNIKHELVSSVDFYKKRLNSVNVISVTDTELQIQWQYNNELHYKLKNQYDRSQFYWRKTPQGEWQFYVKRAYVPVLIELFNEYNFDTTQLLEESSDSLYITTTTPEIVNMTVIREFSDIDLLSIHFEPLTQDIIESIKTIPNFVYISKTKTYKIHIEYANRLYQNLPNYVDKTELKQWSLLVLSWEEDFELKDWSKIPSLPFTPYSFQPTDAKMLLKLKCGLNANEVGCGKTFEQVLIGESIPKPKLVICPATLRLNWKREILMVNPKADVKILYSDKPYSISKEWNIISYNSLSKFQVQLELEMIPIIMADEAHYIQAISSHGTPNSKRAKNVLRLAATAGWVFPITGTPKTNRNKNIFNILKMIRHPLTRGKLAWKRFSTTFCTGDYDTNGSSNDNALHTQLLPYMVRHLKKDVLPYLQKQRQAIPVEVDLVDYHKQIENYMATRKFHDSRALVALNAAKQIIARQKVPYTLDYIQSFLDSDEKVVVVTCYTEVVKAIERKFKSEVLKIVGGMTDNQKQETINNFQYGNQKIIVLNYDAGGVGITLTASHTMILNDLPWVPGIVSQAEGRIWRPGQSDIAQIYFIVANDCLMDNIMVNTIVNKSKSINVAIDGGFGDDINLRDLLDKALTKHYTK